MKRKTTIALVVGIGLVMIFAGIVAAETLVSDFESGSTSDLHTNWNDTWDGDGTLFNATTTGAISESYSARLHANNNNPSVYLNRDTSLAMDNLTVQIKVDTNTSVSDIASWIARNSNNKSATSVWFDRDKEDVIARSTAGNHETFASFEYNTAYRIVTKFNYSANTYKAKLYKLSDGSLVGESSWVDMQNTASKISTIELSNNLGSSGKEGYAWIDNIRVDNAPETVSGTITDSGGNAIDSATVYFNQSGSNVAKDTTDSNGAYSVSLSDGTYDVKVTKDGYQDTTDTITVSGSDLTKDFTLTKEPSSSDTFEYTLGVCYTTDEEFDPHDLAKASWAEGAEGSDAITTGHTLTDFDTAGNTTQTVKDSIQYHVVVTTDRTYIELGGIAPNETSPYDQFAVTPPFGTGNDPTCGDSTREENKPPKVSYTTDPPVLPAPGETMKFRANASDPDGTVDEYEWFIDGESVATGKEFSHTFDEQGSPKVTLIATDDDGEFGIYTRTIFVEEEDGNGSDADANETNTPPVAYFEYSPFMPVEGQDVTFTEAANDPDGEIVSYEWNLGWYEGNPTGKQVTGSWSLIGDKNISLTVTDDDGATSTYQTWIFIGQAAPNQAPSVWYSYDPLTPTANESITFEADASDIDGYIDSYQWSFGDGGTATGRTPTHTFAEPGDYEVTVNVTDNGSAVGTYTSTVSVGDPSDSNLAPTAFYTWEPKLPQVGETVTLTADAKDTDGSIAEYRWILPNGSVLNGPQISFAPSNEGNNDVTLEVVDDQGAVGTYEASIIASDGQGIDGPTAMGICSAPADNGTTLYGIQLEYWDPTYNTTTLVYNVTYNETWYNGSKSFETAKGYYYGCVNLGGVTPGDEGNGTFKPCYLNGSCDEFNGSFGGGGGFDLGGGGGGGIFSDDAGSGAPVWAVGIPAIAALGYVGYRRYIDKTGGAAASEKVRAVIRGRGGG